MTKILSIIQKDLLILGRDRAALVLMLLAPFLLTISMGAITGGFDRSADPDAPQGIQDIPLIIINRDEGEMGQALVKVLQSAELDVLLAPTLAESDIATEAAVRQQVEADQIAALVLIPAGFSEGAIPDQQTGEFGVVNPVEIYASLSRPISRTVIEAVVAEFMNEVALNTAVMQVTMTQLILSGKIPLDEAFTQGEAIAQELFGNQPVTGTETGSLKRLLTIDSQLASGQTAPSFNPLTYLAPGMAIFFLMYTVTVGGRSILAEQEAGTLDRLLTTPATMPYILLGKVAAIFVSGVLQVSVLILTSALLFGLSWGSPLAVALLILSASAAATAWGVLITSLAKNAGQVGAYGSAVMLLFGIVGGSFVPVQGVPGFSQLSKLTPNGWALDGFYTLGTGGSLPDITTALLALWLMALLVFATAVGVYRMKQ